jgi:hypothetical protein
MLNRNKTPFDRFAATSPVNGGRKEACLKRNLIPPPFTGEVSAKLTEGATALKEIETSKYRKFNVHEMCECNSP